MSLLPLSMTFWDYDRVQALADGRVGIEGCDPVYFGLDIHDIFFRAIRNQEFDITEIRLRFCSKDNSENCSLSGCSVQIRPWSSRMTDALCSL